MCASLRVCIGQPKKFAALDRTRPAGCCVGECDDPDSKSANRAWIHRHSFEPLHLLWFSLPILLMAVTRRPFRVIFSHFPFVRILPPPPPALGPAWRGGSGVPGAAVATISGIAIKVKKMAVQCVHTYGGLAVFDSSFSPLLHGVIITQSVHQLHFVRIAVI